MVRHNNQLPDNLPQLQNLIKRDAESYKQEFLQQYRHFSSLLDVFNLHPDQYEKKLEELIMFLAQVAHCYPTELSTLPQEFMNILQSHHTKLNADMRMTLCKALILLRNKNLLAPTDLLALFFNLLRCQDKNLRSFLQLHIITDIKNVNSKSKSTKLNTTLQNFMYKMLSDSNAKAAKMSVDIMIELYRKNIWNDAKTVNVIATALFSKQTKVLVAALKFFTSSDEPVEEKDDSDSEDELTPRDVIMANKFNKKTRKRERQLKKIKQLFAKKKKKQSAPVYNFSALHLVHDPQGLAERLFRQLETRHERFEVKLMSLDVISRLIGLHQLILLNFYPYVQRFIQPHQREVTKILVFVAQSAHELVPPDTLEPVVKTLVNNFITERNSSDVISIGLNAVREICSRCPLVMTTDLLHDLSQYKKYKEKSVMMAAHSLIHLFRSQQPDMLRRKDRGRPTEASVEVQAREFGEVASKSYVPGAEVLSKPATISSTKETTEEDSDGEWVDIPDDGSNIEISDSGESDGEWRSADESEEDDDEEEEDDDSDDDGDEEESGEEEGKKSVANKKQPKSSLSESTKEGEKPKSKEDIAMEISMARILTDEDFKRIDAAQMRKQMRGVSKGKKRAAEEDAIREKGELVSLGDIENIYKKRRHDKEARVETVRKGQEGREKFGFKVNRQNPHASTTNREKKKNKNFMMVRHKARGKIKRSFKDKQLALRNHLIKQKKMK